MEENHMDQLSSTNLREVKIKWENKFKFYTPLEKLIAIVLSGQIMTSIGKVLNIHIVDSIVNHILDKYLAESPYKKEYIDKHEVYMFVGSEESTIEPNVKLLTKLKKSIVG